MRKKGYVTIKDIAKALGISPSTVSRALRDLPDVKAETRKAVKALAEDWHYAPNLFASSLVNSKSNLLGVIVPQINSHFFANVISGIQQGAHLAGYRVIICESKGDAERESLDLHALLSARVAGIIAAPAAGSLEDGQHWIQVERQGVPLVFVDRVCAGLDTHAVLVEDFQASLKATKALLAEGRRHILHLAGPPGLTVSQRREQGYIAALKYAGLTPDPEYVIETGFSASGGEKGLHTWLQKGLPLDGILGINDQVCIGAMQVLKRKNISVPETISLIGFSDNPISAVHTPTLSTVHQPDSEMGTEAFALLESQIEGREGKNQKKVVKRLETSLILRESCLQSVLQI